tara:strand:- start:2032 stop:2985 length:954 start_codon:yes stop_codon:yes gene_type:complete
MISEPQEIETKLIQTTSASHQRNAERIKRDEKELEALLKQARGDTDETEEAVEEESSSSESVQPKVQAESSTQQEEKPQAEAQEDEANLTGEEKNFKKRYGDLRRHTQEKEKAFQEQLDKLQLQLDAATKNELVLPKSEDEVEAWAKKYPDVAGIVEAIADKKANERANELDGRLKEIESLRSTAKREKAEAELTQIHPDFISIREDDSFHAWADNQPKWVQDALYENTDDAKSVARVIDLYKADKGLVTKRSNSSDKGAASSVKSKRSAAPEPEDSSSFLRESQVAKMTIKEYEKRAEEIMEAQRNGKFVYDLSKK